jgi:hypothetical protein
MSPMVRSSLSVSSASAPPPAEATGVMSEITPTRKPPESTSLPGTSAAPLATRTLSCVVGTNGSPWLAL